MVEKLLWAIQLITIRRYKHAKCSSNLGCDKTDEGQARH